MSNKGIKISLWGIAVEAIGLVADIFHHLNIGIKTSEGLITPNHSFILAGFIINFIGFLIISLSQKK